MRYIYFLFAVINLLQLALTAGVYVKAPCPDIKTKSNFEIDKYGQGIWYEAARYPNDIDKKGECPETTIFNENGRHRFKATEIVDGEKISFEGYYDTPPNAGNTGVLSFHGIDTKVDELSHDFPVHILETDYDNFAMGYECTYNKETETRHDYVWIVTRDRNIGEDTRKNIDDAVKATGYIDSDKLQWLHHTDEYCKVKHA